jgi:Ras-related protein Rab-5C
MSASNPKLDVINNSKNVSQKGKSSKTAKVVFAGSTNVGKSSIVHRSCHSNRLALPSPTVGAAFNKIHTIRDNKIVYLEIWDTAGQERFRSLCPMYFRNCSYCILVFDINDHSTFIDAKTWKTLCDQTYVQKTGTKQPPVYFLIGNKIDIDRRAVKLSEIQTYCIDNDIAGYIETSAHTGIGVEELFEKLYDHVYNNDTTLPESEVIETTPTCAC